MCVPDTPKTSGNPFMYAPLISPTFPHMAAGSGQVRPGWAGNHMKMNVFRTAGSASWTCMFPHGNEAEFHENHRLQLRLHCENEHSHAAGLKVQKLYE